MEKNENPTKRKFNLKELLCEFLSRTSVPGLSHISTRRSCTLKVFWVIVIATSFCMGIYQSYGVITDYFSYQITTTNQIVPRNDLEFPAVTICSNTPISVNETLDNGGVADQCYQQCIGVRDLDKKCLRCWRNLTEEQRLMFDTRTHVLHVWEPRVTYDADDDIFYQDVVKEFHDLHFGRCFTFNHKLTPDQPTLKNIEGLGLIAIVGSEFKFRRPYDFANRVPANVLIIHEPRTAPAITPDNVIHIYPTSELHIKVKYEIIESLPYPYPSKCVEAVPNNHSAYYTAERPYTYSINDCTNSCLQRFKTEVCDCFYSQIPVNNLALSESITLCDNPLAGFEMRSCKANPNTTHEECRCPQKCHELKYVVSADVRNKHTEQEIFREYLLANPTYYNEHGRNVTYEEKLKHLKGYWSAVRITTDFVQVTLRQEQAKYTLSDFGGIIGGNIGLWIGVSVITLVEFIELVVGIAVGEFSHHQMDTIKTTKI